MKTALMNYLNFLQSARAAARPAVAIMILGLLCSPSAVHAALVSYTSEAAWQSAVTSPTLIDFDNLADGTVVSNQYPGVTFSPFNGGIPLAAAESFPYSLPNVLAVDNPLLGGGGGGVTIGFASSKGGVAFWYSDSQFEGNSATVYNSSNQILGIFKLEFPHPTEWLFVGFTSSNNDISKIDIAMVDRDRVTLDNVQTAVPLPAAVWLFGTGLLTLLGTLKKRQLNFT